MVNNGTRVAPVNNAFCSSRNAALFERKTLQYTNLSIICHHCTMNEIDHQSFTMSDVLACVSICCADQKKHSILDFLTETFDFTPQTCVDVTNGYLQAYNLGTDVRKHLFCSLHKCNCAGCTMFLFAFLLSNWFFRKKQYFHIVFGQNSNRRRDLQLLQFLVLWWAFLFMAVFFTVFPCRVY